MIEDSGWQYLELSDVEAIRREWRLPVVNRPENLESALARPRQSFGDLDPFPSAETKAAALGWGLARSHGLVDGNKRLGAIATIRFLQANGYDATLTERELVAIFEACANSTMTEEEVALFLRPRLTLAPETIVMSGDEFTAMIQPHLDAIHLFTQQAGTEDLVAEGDFYMVMGHVRALVEIAKGVPEGPVRDAMLSMLDSFSGLTERFRFIESPAAEAEE